MRSTVDVMRQLLPELEREQAARQELAGKVEELTEEAQLLRQQLREGDETSRVQRSVIRRKSDEVRQWQERYERLETERDQERRLRQQAEAERDEERQKLHQMEARLLWKDEESEALLQEQDEEHQQRVEELRSQLTLQSQRREEAETVSMEAVARACRFKKQCRRTRQERDEAYRDRDLACDYAQALKDKLDQCSQQE